MRNDFFEPERGPNLVGWALRQLLIWGVGGLVLYGAVTNHLLFRTPSPETQPQSATVQPDPELSADPPGEKLRPLGQPAPIVSHTLSLRAQPDGYAYVKASVNGLPMTMAFDTGASFVSLTEADAIKAGVAGNLNYTVPMSTANGRNFGAPVMLREIRIGQLVIEDVQAVVVQHLWCSLLGQTFLHRLHSYQMQGDVLTLTWQ
jgi:aspartyl protease family protein